MASRFHGWPDQAEEVLLQLEGEPSPQVRERVRRDRESQVRQPMISLLSDLADVDPWYEDFAVWRYASMAYWWQNQCAIVRVARHVDIGFRFSLDGLQVKGAWWYAGPEQIASFRAAVAGDETARAGGSGVVAGRGRARGRRRCHEARPAPLPGRSPRAGLLRHRSLTATCDLDPDAVRDVEPVYRACERLRPLLAWLTEHTAVAPEDAEVAAARGQAGGRA